MNNLDFSQFPHPLLPNQIHLWLCDLSQLAMEKILPHEQILSPDELKKIHAFKRRREQAFATRLFVRICLAQYIQQSPETLMFNISDNGKPELVATPIRFNLSHSEDFLLLGVCATADIGVDLQAERKGIQFINLAERYFHADEFNRLQDLSGNEQKNYFYRLWTLKEAFFKALGTGISTGLDKICFQLNTDENKFLTSAACSISFHLDAQLNLIAQEWQVAQSELLPQLHAAVAVKNLQPFEIILLNGNRLLEGI